MDLVIVKADLELLDIDGWVVLSQLSVLSKTWRMRGSTVVVLQTRVCYNLTYLRNYSVFHGIVMWIEIIEQFHSLLI